MKVPKPRRLPSGNWFIQMRLGGESVSVTDPSEKQCVKAAQLLKAEYLAGKRVTKKPERVTLAEIVERYITSRQNVLSPSTIRGYRIIQRTRFQAYSSQEIHAIDWQSLVNEEAALCSPKTLHNAWMLLSSAVYAGTGTRPVATLPQVPKNTRLYLTPAQIDLFTGAIQNTDVEIPALLGLCSLRCSEILGLKWRNVDLEKGIVYVRGSAVRGSDGKLIYKDTNKNRTSNRVVPIMPQLMDALQKAPEHLPDDPVVSCSQQSIYTRVNTICRKNKLPEIGVHGLRHSFASLAYHLNVPYKVAMEIGGWSDDHTMQKIYTHIAEEDIRAGAESLVNFYSKSKNANENANEN